MGKRSPQDEAFKHQENIQQSQQNGQRKSKAISKNEKQQLSKDKIKRGRPTKNEIQPLKYSSSDYIKNSFIKYLQDIGFKQGLVFSQRQREKLQKEQEQNSTLPSINWDKTHTWKKQEQVMKVLQVIGKQENMDQIVEFFLDIADIFPREITYEIYELIWLLYSSSLDNPMNDKAIQSLCANILKGQLSKKYIFLTNKFSSKYKSSKQSRISSQFRKFCKTICKYLRQPITKFQRKQSNQ